MEASAYSALETLRDGRQVEIRALKPEDRDGWLAYIGRTSDASRYQRFMGPKAGFSEREIAFHVNVDFVSHVALVAVLEEGGEEIGIGGGRYIVTQPGRATLAFQIDDAHQGLGTATHLMRHLVIIARSAGLKELDAEVLSTNRPMLTVFQRSGLAMKNRREAGITEIVLTL